MQPKTLTKQIAVICISMLSTIFTAAKGEDALIWTNDRDVWDFQLAYDDHSHTYNPSYGRTNETVGVLDGCHIQKNESTNRLYSLSLEKYMTIDTFKSIETGLNQAIAHAKGELDLDDFQKFIELNDKDYKEFAKALDEPLPNGKKEKLRNFLNEASPWDDITD